MYIYVYVKQYFWFYIYVQPCAAKLLLPVPFTIAHPCRHCPASLGSTLLFHVLDFRRTLSYIFIYYHFITIAIFQHYCATARFSARFCFALPCLLSFTSGRSVRLILLEMSFREPSGSENNLWFSPPVFPLEHITGSSDRLLTDFCLLAWFRFSCTLSAPR